MARGLLDPPNLDDRTWQDIVDECRALIPRYAPEWTDHNPSDLGITLVELFAWLVEGMIYRLNRVPEKNFIEFLNLLGISRDPATPAATFVTYSSAGAATLPAGSQAATIQSTTEPPIVFETDAALQVLPTTLASVAFIKKFLAWNLYKNATKQLVTAPLGGFEAVAFVGNEFTLALGFDQASSAQMTVLFRFMKAMFPGPVVLEWRYSRGTTLPSSWPILPGVAETTSAFQKNGSATFTVPLDWAPQNPKALWTATIQPESLADEIDQPLYWVSVRVQTASATGVSVAFERVLFNSVQATNVLTVASGEVLGTSTGKPFQSLSIRNVPLYKRPAAKNPYDHLVLQVREPQVGGGFGAWTTWQRVEHFPAGAAQVFRLDPVTGTVSFGNYDAATPLGHGSIPAAGSEVRAQTYRYVGGGARGNVGANSIVTLRTPPPAGVTGVTNHGPASGGSDQETIEDTKRRAPELLRNRSRALTAEDYEYLAAEATTDVRKVRCLTPRLWSAGEFLADGSAARSGQPWTFANLNRDSGNVNVLVIGDAPITVARPSPSDGLIREVTDYLDDRRIVTANLHVTGPLYVPIKATVNVNVWSKAINTGLVPDVARYRSDLISRIGQFFHPLYGRGDGKGWNFGQDATIAELLDFIRPDGDVGFISALTIEATQPPYINLSQPQATWRPFAFGAPGVWVQLADYEIVCADSSHAVTVTPI